MQSSHGAVKNHIPQETELRLTATTLSSAETRAQLPRCRSKARRRKQTDGAAAAKREAIDVKDKPAAHASGAIVAGTQGTQSFSTPPSGLVADPGAGMQVGIQHSSGREHAGRIADNAGDAPVTAARETFAELDGGSAVGAPRWTHAADHQVEAGFEDPAAGLGGRKGRHERRQRSRGAYAGHGRGGTGSGSAHGGIERAPRGAAFPGFDADYGKFGHWQQRRRCGPDSSSERRHGSKSASRFQRLGALAMESADRHFRRCQYARRANSGSDR